MPINFGKRGLDGKGGGLRFQVADFCIKCLTVLLFMNFDESSFVRERAFHEICFHASIDISSF
jgi:hypothetical protein